jgi:hypothetical protein
MWIKIMEKLELRMYGLVIYNISPIQAGIQFQHAVTRYGREQDSKLYRDWADNWQTSIVLNGGTTNSNLDRLGTINKAYHGMLNKGIVCQHFSEPDLGDQMTAFCLIVDERVFNKKKYPDYGFDYDEINDCFVRNNFHGLKPDSTWIESIGGEKNLYLRTTLGKLSLWK